MFIANGLMAVGAPLSVFGGHAVRIVVCEMGNGVDRVEAAALVPVAQARREAGGDDRCALPTPLSHRLADLLMAGLLMVGMAAGDVDLPRVRGYARAMSMRHTEVTAWEADGAGG